MDIAIEITGVSKDYPGIKAVDGINFSVKKGSIHGFLGPNGAGKSTTMKIIAGILKQDEGKIKILGLDTLKERERTTHMIGYLPETPPLYENMVVEDYLTYVAKINGVRKSNLKQKVTETIEKTGLVAVRKRLLSNLSKGYKQRAGIASALVFGPQVIILDEPTVGLDPVSIEEIRQLIKDLSKECTVMLSTHQLYEAHQLCTDITIINKGKIIESGEIGEVREGFKTRQVIKAIVNLWNDELKNNFLKEFDAQDIEVNYEGNNIALKIFMSDKRDSRAQVSEYLVKNNCNLLALEEEELDLNDIFKIATAKGDVK